MNCDAAMRAYLVSLTGITNVFSTRVYDTILPEDPTLPALIYATDGGGDDPDGLPLASPEYRVTAWASTLAGSKTGYEAASDAILAIANYRSGTIILQQAVGAKESQAQSDRHEETGYYYTSGRWVIFARDDA